MNNILNKQLETTLYKVVKAVKEDLENNLKPSIIGQVVLSCCLIEDPIYEREVVDIGISTVAFNNGDVLSYHDITHEPEFNILMGSTRDMMNVLTLIYKLPRFEKVKEEYKEYFSKEENQDNPIYKLLKSLEEEGEIEELGF